MSITSKIKSLVLGAAILPAILWAKPGDPLCFTSEQDGSTLAYGQYASLDHLECRLGDDGDWQKFETGRTYTLNEGAKLYLRSSLDEYTSIGCGNNYSRFTIGGQMGVSGDVTTLLKKTGSNWVDGYAFYQLFYGCPITTAPELPATELGGACYSRMFIYCGSLTEPPELPATTLAEDCYESMFYGSGLTRAPVLPATNLAENCYMRMLEECKFSEPPELPNMKLEARCYQEMFRGCRNLTRAPVLPATNLALSCYSSMFSDCPLLTEAPELPATTLANNCYGMMFWDCVGLTQAPELPATTLANACYYRMFLGCTSLTAAPALPCTNVEERCYAEMFSGCTRLMQASELPATKLAKSCYDSMFQRCTGLVEPPELPAVELVEGCYAKMFYGCTAIKESPVLPAPTLADKCYYEMFYDCSSLQKVSLLAKEYTWGRFERWLEGVAPTGTVMRPDALTLPTKTADGVPEGWTQETLADPSEPGPDDPPVGPEDPEDPEPPSREMAKPGDPLRFTSLAPSNPQFLEYDAIGLSVAADADPKPVFEYRKNRFVVDRWEADENNVQQSVGHWEWDDWQPWDTRGMIVVAARGGAAVEIRAATDSVQKIGGFPLKSSGGTWNMFSNFEFIGPFKASGDVTTLLCRRGTDTVGDGDFGYLFSGCESLKSAPDLLATNLQSGSYHHMFQGSGIEEPPLAVTGTTLPSGCCMFMFQNCAKLKWAPALPATTLAESCYLSMFWGCTSLKRPPELPATTLAERCYESMFWGCTSLKTPPALPATTLASGCYSGMFSDCSALKSAPLLPATRLAEGCYEFLFSGCVGITNVTLMALGRTDGRVSRDLENWLYHAGVQGVITCPKSLDIDLDSVSGVPPDWTLVRTGDPTPDDPTDDPPSGSVISGVEPDYTFVAGVAIEPIVPTVGEGWSVKVTGLPAGLKYAAATGVTGTPTKSGTSQVIFTATKSGEENVIVTTEITVRNVALTVDVSGTGTGKVKGAGEYAAGKKVTLKATADTKDAAATATKPTTVKSVFSGWYDAAGDLVSRLTSYVLTMPPTNVSLTAKFIALTDDVAAVSFALPDELATGVTAVNALVDVSGCASLPTVKVTGLPAGLKFTAKDILKKGSKTDVDVPANTIYGKPTKSGVYAVVATVTTAGKRTASASQTVVVRKAGEFVVKAEVPPVGDAVPGKVTGMGVYAKDKKVTLKATANKGYVFSGWYDGDALVSRLASYVLTMPEEDVSLTAAFVTSDADKTSIAASVDGLALEPWVSKDVTQARATNVTAGVYLEWPVAASALSATTVKVSGLPSGLKFTAKGIYKKGSKTEVDVPANTIYGAPTAASKAGKPSQMKVTVTTAGKSKAEYAVELTVDPLPAWAVGTFAGPSYGEGGTNGVANVTVATSGKISAKQPVNGKSASFAAACFDRYDAEAGAYVATLTAKVGKEVVTNVMAVAEAEIGMGFIEADLFDAWQHNWKVEPWKTVGKSFDKREVSYEEDGVTVTLKFSAKGTAKVAGEFTDASGKAVKATGSATLLPTAGEGGGTRYIVFVYLAPKGLPPHARCVEVQPVL